MARITLRGVCVEIPIFDTKFRSIRHTLLKRANIGGHIDSGAGSTLIVRALEDVSLDIKDGQRVALLGGNGAGKSTLLRVISGAYPPTAGAVEVRGEVSSLIDKQLGIDPEATGMENIMLRGLSLGLTRQSIRERAEAIADFSGLGQYLAAPVRTYSHGMRLRLALAVAMNIEPEILLLDEWIGAGDARFGNKVRPAIHDLVDQSNIMVLATHNLAMVQKVCTHAVLLDQGRMVGYGPATDIIEQYNGTKVKIVRNRSA